jgi:hypothetical protein
MLLVLVIVGVVLLLLGYVWLGVVLIVLGAVLAVALDAPYGGRSYWHRGP